MANQGNSLPELVELLLRTVSGEAGNWDVRVELRINSGDLDCPDGTAFNVGFKRAWLKLERSGVEIAPNSRHGEPTKPNAVAIKQKTSSERVVEREAGAHAGLSAQANTSNMQAGLDAKAGASAKHNVRGKTTVSTSASESTSHLRVKARPAEQWEVSESQGNLDGTYLNDDVLCRLAALDRANAKSVELHAFARQKDLVLEVTHNGSKIPFKSINHEKLLKVLIGKALSAAGSRYAGTILFSKSESELEE